MLNPLRKLVFAASLGAGIASFVSVASALPVLDALAIKNAAPPTSRAGLRSWVNASRATIQY